MGRAYSGYAALICLITHLKMLVFEGGGSFLLMFLFVVFQLHLISKRSMAPPFVLEHVMILSGCSTSRGEAT